ncbi:tripartite tricarboxylate transporter substrate-binding protein [Chelativorans alearense]|uniref:tripartite tricarboxylate transporter substrate-binding protein n=1 Tax=Chelativorans alearense TaxID=2681495 RepID=UPI0013D3F9D6|nr:tripartite tricarboxylate transporter substrate-binding protein [Chelativorans alearense]
MDRIQEHLVDLALAVKFDALSCDEIALAKAGLVACLGNIVTALSHDVCRTAHRLAGRSPQRCGAALIGTRTGTSVELAAFANATAALCLEPGDDAARRQGVIVPAVLASAESAQASGRMLIEALVAGERTACWLQKRYPLSDGFSPASFASIGSALGCGRVFGLSRDQLGQAASLAAMTSVFLLETEPGCPLSSHQPAGAYAARAGAFAALAAREGMTGPARPFEGKTGWVAELAGEAIAEDPAVAGMEIPTVAKAPVAENLKIRFERQVAPVLGGRKAADLWDRIWSVEALPEVWMVFDCLRRRCIAAGLNRSSPTVPSLGKGHSRRSVLPVSGYPDRPIRIIVPGSKGGPGNIIADTIAEKLSAALSQPIEIAPAKSQTAGLKETAEAPPDGYTLGMGGGSFFLSAALYKSLPFDPRADFAPVNLVAGIANVLVVHPSVPVLTVAEFIDYAKANPGVLKYGSSGYGSPPHIAGATFARMAGIDIVHVSHKGHVVAGNTLAEGKELQLMFDAVPTAMSHIRAGELRGLGVTTSRRLPALPDIPTIAEEGLPGYELNPFMGMLAPAGTPEEVLEKIAVEVGKITRMPDVRQKLEAIGIEAVSSTRKEFTSYMTGQFATWAKALEAAGIEPLEAPKIA